MTKDEKDACYQILSFGLWWILSYTKQDYYWPRSSHLNYFEEPYIPPSREELYVEKHIFLGENIEIFEEISEDIVIEEESEIKN